MARTLGNKFIAFITVLIVTAIAAGFAVGQLTDDATRDAAVKGFMIGFDLAALLFLLTCLHLLRIDDPAVMREHAAANDGNRTTLLLVTAAISAAILGAVAMQTMGDDGPGMKTKILVVGTLLIAWLFANTIYALHYAHLYYWEGNGIAFPKTQAPGYADFVYFAFTLGMTFQTSDVAIEKVRIRNVATLHCLAAFVFNLGVLAFTINVLGSG